MNYSMLCYSNDFMSYRKLFSELHQRLHHTIPRNLMLLAPPRHPGPRPTPVWPWNFSGLGLPAVGLSLHRDILSGLLLLQAWVSRRKRVNHGLNSHLVYLNMGHLLLLHRCGAEGATAITVVSLFCWSPFLRWVLRHHTPLFKDEAIAQRYSSVFPFWKLSVLYYYKIE
jgi:hypothetical protein